MIGWAPARRSAAMTCSPTPATADDDRRLPRLDARGVSHRPERGHDAAPEERGRPERQSGRERHGSSRGDDRALGEAGGHESVLERCSVRQREPRRPVHGHAARAVLAGRNARLVATRPALAAGTARVHDAEADVIPAPDVRYRISDCLHHACTLVSHHHRPAPSPSSPSARRTSEWQTPAAATRTRTSSSCGGARSTSSTTSACRGPWRTAARIRINRPGTARARRSRARRRDPGLREVRSSHQRRSRG